MLEPTIADVTAWTEEIIEAGSSDAKAKRLIDLIFAVAGDGKRELAEAAAQAAYLLTNDFQESFDMFAGRTAVKKTYLTDNGIAYGFVEIPQAPTKPPIDKDSSDGTKPESSNGIW